jgi:hypothetical protein
VTKPDPQPAGPRHLNLRALRRRLGVFLVCLIGTAVAYRLLLRGAHHSAVLYTAGGLLNWIDQDIGLVLVPAGRSEPILDGIQRKLSISTNREALDVLLVGTVFLPSLILATALPWTRRLTAAAFGLVVLLGLQAIQVAVTSHAAYQSMIGQGSATSAFLQTACNYAGLLLPLPIWWFLALRPAITKDIPRIERGTDQVTTPRPLHGNAPRNAPCPCGSGAKFKKCCGAT